MSSPQFSIAFKSTLTLLPKRNWGSLYYQLPFCSGTKKSLSVRTGKVPLPISSWYKCVRLKSWYFCLRYLRYFKSEFDVMCFCTSNAFLKRPSLFLCVSSSWYTWVYRLVHYIPHTSVTIYSNCYVLPLRGKHIMILSVAYSTIFWVVSFIPNCKYFSLFLNCRGNSV